MAELSLRMLTSFRDELRKEARSAEVLKLLARHARKAPAVAGKAVSSTRKFVSSPQAHSLAGGTAGGAGAGGLIGGALGAGEGAVEGYRQAREQGQGVGGSLVSGLARGGRRAVQRAGQGVVIGAAAGGAAGAASGKVPGVLAKTPGVGIGARFGQRQLHGLTGWTPEAGIRSIRGGAYTAGKDVEDAAKALRKAVGKGAGIEKAQKGLARSQKHLGYASEAERMGLTSLPGYAKALAKNPGKALKTGFGEQWHGTPGAMKALVYGGTGASVGGELTREDPEGKGRGKLERAGRALGSSLPFLAGPLPITATMAATPMAASAGGMVGRLAGKVGKKKRSERHAPAPPSLDPAGGDTQPSEYMYSDRAAGIPPEGLY